MTSALEEHGNFTKVHPTRLKLALLEQFPDFTEEKGRRNRVYLICSKTARKIISEAVQAPEEESRALLLAASILRKAVVEHDSKFSFNGSFPERCEETAVPSKLKYFSRQVLLGPKSSPIDDNSRKVLSVSQITMLNMTPFSRNLKVEPPLSVFLALNIHSQTRSKKLVQLWHDYCLSVTYNTVLTIEARFAKAVADQARLENDVVCSTNSRQHIFTVAALDNLDNNPSYRTATSSFHGTGIMLDGSPSLFVICNCCRKLFVRNLKMETGLFPEAAGVSPQYPSIKPTNRLISK